MEKDETQEMTGKLDEEWKSLAGLLGGVRPVKKDEVRSVVNSLINSFIRPTVLKGRLVLSIIH